jgi:hypothetical protein
MKNIGLPRRRIGDRPKLHISPEQFDSLVRLIPEPYATMIFTAMFSGLRVSELVALKWRDLGYDSISVDERYCRGDWGEPKSQSANATIGMDRSVVERIHALKLLTVSVRARRRTEVQARKVRWARRPSISIGARGKTDAETDPPSAVRRIDVHQAPVVPRRVSELVIRAVGGWGPRRGGIQGKIRGFLHLGPRVFISQNLTASLPIFEASARADNTGFFGSPSTPLTRRARGIQSNSKQ